MRDRRWRPRNHRRKMLKNCGESRSLTPLPHTLHDCYCIQFPHPSLSLPRLSQTFYTLSLLSLSCGTGASLVTHLPPQETFHCLREEGGTKRGYKEEYQRQCKRLGSRPTRYYQAQTLSTHHCLISLSRLSFCPWFYTHSRRMVYWV